MQTFVGSANRKLVLFAVNALVTKKSMSGELHADQLVQ
ncbi:hypothetical protein P615_03995 [Brevibacillus laterosporus PE36]|nr:hypothetical protein P615_03995 [Brevibacillus laterosporus PE36]